jgi:hypothetical protein
MRAILVVVGNVLAKQSLQMAFVDGNDVIQKVTAAAAYPELRDTVLPGTCEGSPDRTYFQGANGCGDFQPVFCVAIENEEAWSRIKRERLPQLLNNPQAHRMPCDIAVQNAPAIVANDEEAVKHSEGERRHCEEIDRRNGSVSAARTDKRVCRHRITSIENRKG